MPYLTHRIGPIWKLIPIRFFKSHRIFRPSYNTFYINHTLLCLSQASYIFWGRSKVIFVKIAQNFVNSPLKICFISESTSYGMYGHDVMSDSAVVSSVCATLVPNVTLINQLGRVKRIWYLSPMRAAKVQANLRGSPEPPLLAHTSIESGGTFRQKARSLAPLNGWAWQLKFVMMECSKTQIRLTRPN